jgi:hypothetical protein
VILSSFIIQCSSFSEREFLELEERLGLLEQNVYNDDRLTKLENQYNDLDESKCEIICFHYITKKIN